MRLRLPVLRRHASRGPGPESEFENLRSCQSHLTHCSRCCNNIGPMAHWSSRIDKSANVEHAWLTRTGLPRPQGFDSDLLLLGFPPAPARDLMIRSNSQLAGPSAVFSSKTFWTPSNEGKGRRKQCAAATCCIWLTPSSCNPSTFLCMVLLWIYFPPSVGRTHICFL